MVRWGYSMIAELKKCWDESGGDTKKTAIKLGLSIASVDSAVRRYLKKDTAQYKRRTNTMVFKISHGK